jgi:hypothetical protein
MKMVKQVFAAKLRRLAAILFLVAILFIAAPFLAASAQAPTHFLVGDACQLTQTVQVCQNLAKVFKQASGLYVAVATSSLKASAGVSHGQPTQSAAEQVAMANCKALGATDCETANHGQNTCMGIAVSYIRLTSMATKTDFGYGFDSNRSTAGTQALSNCKKSAGQNCTLLAVPCSTDNPEYPSRLPQPAGGTGSVDPNLVGTWEIEVGQPSTGRWLWQVTGNGTYEVHSEAFDGAPTNAGTFSAGAGQYTLHATNISWDDSGTYSFQPPGTLVATGKLGTGTWHKIAQDDQ